MDVARHLHRTNVLNSILALWAEHEELSFKEVLGYFFSSSTDEEVIETAKRLLQPKKTYYMIYFNPKKPTI